MTLGPGGPEVMHWLCFQQHALFWTQPVHDSGAWGPRSHAQAMPPGAPVAESIASAWLWGPKKPLGAQIATPYCTFPPRALCDLPASRAGPLRPPGPAGGPSATSKTVAEGGGGKSAVRCCNLGPEGPLGAPKSCTGYAFSNWRSWGHGLCMILGARGPKVMHRPMPPRAPAAESIASA